MQEVLESLTGQDGRGGLLTRQSGRGGRASLDRKAGGTLDDPRWKGPANRILPPSGRRSRSLPACRCSENQAWLELFSVTLRPRRASASSSGCASSSRRKRSSPEGGFPRGEKEVLGRVPGKGTRSSALSRSAPRGCRPLRARMKLSWLRLGRRHSLPHRARRGSRKAGRTAPGQSLRPQQNAHPD